MTTAGVTAQVGFNMKHKIKIPIEEEVRTLFGKKKVIRYKIVYVDGKTYASF